MTTPIYFVFPDKQTFDLIEKPFRDIAEIGTLSDGDPVYNPLTDSYTSTILDGYHINVLLSGDEIIPEEWALYQITTPQHPQVTWAGI